MRVVAPGCTRRTMLRACFPCLVALLAACGGGNSEEFSTEVTFTNNFGEPFVGATIATSEGSQVIDVAVTDSSGRASIRAHRGAVVTGYVPGASYYRVSTIVESELPFTLREFLGQAAQIPFRVTGLTAGDPVTVLDLGGTVSGVADSAGDFEGIAWAVRESDGEFLLTASDSFWDPLKWGAVTNVADGDIATLTLSTSFAAVEPSLLVDVRSVSGTSSVGVLPAWQGANLFYSANYALTTSDALLSFRVLGRDVADSVRVGGGGSDWVTVRTLPWPQVESVVLDLADPGFSIDVTASSAGAISLSVSGTADALVGYASDGTSRWEFVFPGDEIPETLVLPPIPASLSTFPVPAEEPFGLVRLLEVDTWTSGDDLFELTSRSRVPPFEANCVDAPFGPVSVFIECR